VKKDIALETLPDIDRALQLEIGQKYGIENTIRWLRGELAKVNANIKFLKGKQRRLGRQGEVVND
jgi:hypothetical protein